MSETCVGEIRLFAGSFAPLGWALCDGTLLSIAENEVLYSLIGTTYGGDGQTTFAVPDLRGRVPVHRSTTYPLAARGGTEAVTLTLNNLAAHTHVPNANHTAGTAASPANAIWADAPYTSYSKAAPNTQLGAISPTGGSVPHENMMPSVAITFIIALSGLYPSFDN